MFYWQEDPGKIQQEGKSGKWLKVEFFAVKGSVAVVNTSGDHTSSEHQQTEETIGHCGFGRTSGLP